MEFKSPEDQIIFDHKIASMRLLEEVKRFLQTFGKEMTVEYIEALISSLQ